MNILFFITALIIAGVNLYCWTYRNKSISDVSMFWLSSGGVMMGLASYFILDFMDARLYAYIIAYVFTALSGYKMCSISIRNIRGEWNGMRTPDEVAKEVHEARSEAIDYVNKAIEELPDKDFTPEFQEEVMNFLKDKR